jgi:acetyltransferase-like isoleucine patch superfamily enzyme
MKFTGRNVNIGKNVKLGENVKIGDDTIIYDNVEIGDNTIICNNSIIGEPSNSYYFDENYINPPTIIGADSIIRSHAILYADSTFGNNFQTGHRVTVREKTIAGNYCSFGSYTDVQGYCVIGNYNRYHSYVNIGQKSEIEDYVFIYPFVVLTNDPTPPSIKLIGVKIKEYSQICANAVLLPGAEIGANSLVAASATVGGTFIEDSFISGNPAKRIGNLSKMPFFSDKKRHYPWQHNFDRGMPWQGLDYDKWLKEKV